MEAGNTDSSPMAQLHKLDYLPVFNDDLIWFPSHPVLESAGEEQTL